MNLLPFLATRRRKDANGYLHVTGCHITKEQIVPYLGAEIPDWQELGLDPGKWYQLLRPAEELRQAAHTSNGVTLLLRHAEDSAEQPKKDIRTGSLGTSAQVVEEDGEVYLDNDLSFHTAEGIEAVESGEKKQLSSAYRYRADMTPGTWRGQPYDGVQRDLQFNHVALVKKGRAGPDVVVADEAPEFFPTKSTCNSEDKMNPNILQKLLAFLRGKKLLAMDADPAQAEALVTELVAEVLEAVPANPAAPPANDNAPAAAPPAEPAVAKDASPLAKLKELLAPLLNGVTEVAGKSVDDWLASLAEALAPAGAPPASVAMDSRPRGMPAPPAPAPALAMDEAAIVKKAEAGVMARFQAKELAVQEVKPLVGEVSIMAFDSAESVYGYAIEQRGLKKTDYPAEAWRGIVKGLVDTQRSQALERTYSGGLAMDAAPDFQKNLATQGIDFGRFKNI